MASFIYDCIDTFCFPNQDTQEIYNKNQIIKIFPFKIFLDNDIRHRLYLSGEFFEQFGKLNEVIRKQVGLYEFENIEQGNVCAICVNLKEYFELYGIYYETNKKHKGVCNGTKGVDFDNYASRILTIDEPRDGTKRSAKKQQTRFQNKKYTSIPAV